MGSDRPSPRFLGSAVKEALEDVHRPVPTDANTNCPNEAEAVWGLGETVDLGVNTTTLPDAPHLTSFLAIKWG